MTFFLSTNMIKKPNSVQFGTEHFGLEPHKSYTLAWTLYPSRDREYFGFINRLRRDWNVNFTIPGMFAGSDKDVPGMQLKFHALTPWFNCYDGVNLSDEQYVKRLKGEVDALTATNPDVVCMPKMETPAFGLIRSKIAGGGKIPMTPKSLTMELNQEQSDIVKKAAGPLWDSMMKSRKCLAVIDTWYTGEAVKDDFNLNVHPELGNSWYKHMLRRWIWRWTRPAVKGSTWIRLSLPTPSMTGATASITGSGTVTR